MVIVETIAVSTMVCNDLVMPLLLRTRRFGAAAGGDLTGVLLGIRRAAIVAVLLLGYLYFHLAGEAYALVSIGLISFAAVAQFAPAMLGGMYWKGGTRGGALAGLAAGFALWVYTLMLPSIAKSGWLAAGFLHARAVRHRAAASPSSCSAWRGLDNLTHSLFWSLLANVGALRRRVAVRARRRRARPARRCCSSTSSERSRQQPAPVFWRGRARVADLLPLARPLPRRAPRRSALFDDYARRSGVGARRRSCSPTRSWCSSSRRSSPARSAAPRRA